MIRLSATVMSVALFAAGGIAWHFTAPKLLEDRAAIPPLNPFGIKRSPYGEVFAMAMQTPIDETFQTVWNGGGHAHDDGVECEICIRRKNFLRQIGNSGNFEVGNLVRVLGEAHATRTNPKPPTPAHSWYLRRKVQDKLRFAYDLDPSHYANYTSLHFFLTEPQLGTRPQLNPSAARLAEDTIRYCLSREDDPRPALTAAAAALHVLELMFNDQRNPSPKFTITQMRGQLALLDHCIARYHRKAREWEQAGIWNNISPQRILECQERIRFITKLRDSAATTIARFENSISSIAS
ncbi:MAG: hypothetical protein V4733_09845 [Verrucomicrobiota bacterium]